MSFTVHKTDNSIEISKEENGQYKSFDDVCTEVISQDKQHKIDSITLNVSGDKYLVTEGVDRFYDRPSYQGLANEFERAKQAQVKSDEHDKFIANERNYKKDEIVSNINFITSSTIAGMKIIETLGMARGSTVRAKHIGRDLMAELKGLVGGEIKGYTELIAEGREEAIYRMKEDAFRMGANAIVDVRFGTSTLTAGFTEMISYGTAVKIQEEE